MKQKAKEKRVNETLKEDNLSEISQVFQKIKDDFIKKNEKDGFILQKEVFDALKQYDLDDAAIEDIMEFFNSQGIEIKLDEDYKSDEEIDLEASKQAFEEDDFGYDFGFENNSNEESLDDENHEQGFESIHNNSKSDPFQSYLKEVGKYDTLKQEKEIELAKKMKKGDEFAKEILINSNLRLVISVAKKYHVKNMDFLDIIQEGNLGLMKAVDKFDFSKGYKFSTYATWWIRQSITRAITDHSKLIRIPAHIFSTNNTINQAKEKLFQELGREPTIEEISEELDGALSPKKIIDIKESYYDPVSLETPIGEEDNTSLGDVIEDTSNEKPIDYTEKKLRREALEKAFKELESREQTALRLRYGFDDHDERTLEEIGKELSVTKERTRQIICRALRKLSVGSLRKFLGQK